MRLLLGALAASFLMLLAAPSSARAVPDGPLRLYLEHLEPLGLSWPADGVVSDPFGMRWGRPHLGIDVGSLRSLEVRAAEPGTVTATGYLDGYSGYGNVVIVDVGDGFEVLYAHLSAAAVRPGQWVNERELLGSAGCTGSCTGTHLHFELRRAGTPVDPAPFID